MSEARKAAQTRREQHKGRWAALNILAQGMAWLLIAGFAATPSFAHSAPGLEAQAGVGIITLMEGAAASVGDPSQAFAFSHDASVIAAGKKGGRPPQNGTAHGERAYMGFTPKGKREVKAENVQKHDGQRRCENCGVDTVEAQKSQKGVTPPGNETQIDHIIPRAKGGDGSPSNGQVLCRECNREKSDKH